MRDDGTGREEYSLTFFGPFGIGGGDRFPVEPLQMSRSQNDLRKPRNNEATMTATGLVNGAIRKRGNRTKNQEQLYQGHFVVDKQTIAGHTRRKQASFHGKGKHFNLLYNLL